MGEEEQDSAEKFWDSVSKRTAKSPALNTNVQKGEVYFNPDDVVLDFGCGSEGIKLAIAQMVILDGYFTLLIIFKNFRPIE